MQLGRQARVMPQIDDRTLREINGYVGIKRKVPVHDLHSGMLARAASIRRSGAS